MPICMSASCVFCGTKGCVGKGNPASNQRQSDPLGVTEPSCTHLFQALSNPPPFLPIPYWDAFKEEGLLFQPCSGTLGEDFDTHTPTHC